MSQWTHVCVAIRFDGLKGMTPDPKLDCKIPRGSEGPLHCELIEVGDGAVRFTAVIWGDLRDYSDIAEIEAYLARIVEGQGIRSGVAEIEVEYKTEKVLRYDRDSELWKTVWEKAKP